MPEIRLLDQGTINKIAAGEVVERPSAVVKELIENAIDAGTTAVTIEIKGGGIDLIRITDNGSGIESQQVRIAFERHATSKIRSAEDLLSVSSLGFRGEALASIGAVAQVELMTKTRGELTGTRYVIHGGEEQSFENVGCPEGTTFVIRNLFYNVPARRKFLKSAQTESSYVNDLVERMAISNPNISFKFINNNQLKLQTSGNGNVKDVLYHVFGRDITSNLVPLKENSPVIGIEGFVAKPVVNRGNRNYMNYFINGRYIKSSI
ncbi:MAG: DNA mismatch repair endonuclease MutL, partial [Lachnospiraceae bacterium]|nr:DNA mismatch repair endonuclease MutL [Lachnospiraceae bacterium]